MGRGIVLLHPPPPTHMWDNSSVYFHFLVADTQLYMRSLGLSSSSWIRKKRAFMIPQSLLCGCVSSWQEWLGWVWGEARGWMRLPTHSQQYCDPASFSNSSFAPTDGLVVGMRLWIHEKKKLWPISAPRWLRMNEWTFFKNECLE